MSRADVTMLDVLWFEATHPRCRRCDEMTCCELAGGCGCRPIWYGIRETDTLQAPPKANDERHVAPLQLGVIERCVRLWSNPGETVLTPFMGIGSEAYVALQHGRKAIGVELKPEYFDTAVRNIAKARAQQSLPFEVPA